MYQHKIFNKFILMQEAVDCSLKFYLLFSAMRASSVTKGKRFKYHS